MTLPPDLHMHIPHLGEERTEKKMKRGGAGGGWKSGKKCKESLQTASNSVLYLNECKVPYSPPPPPEQFGEPAFLVTLPGDRERWQGHVPL